VRSDSKATYFVDNHIVPCEILFLPFFVKFSLVIGMIPMILFYVIFRKQITKGVSAGAVKG